jgi:aspartyl/asparaginyl beta-hydroxylase (cupin superfamily)
MAKLVARITVVTLEPGRQESKVIYKSKKKKAKLSRWLKPMERWQRRSLEAQQAYNGELLARHKKSNRKRRNGFLRDGMLNMSYAQRKAMKKLRKFL